MARANVRDGNSAATSAGKRFSPLRPFKHRAFAVIWTATLVSNIGVWMQNAAAGWLMTTLDPEPQLVAMVQAAASLPYFLLAVPGGALADMFDRRRLLLAMEASGTLLTAGFALMVTLGAASSPSLLAFLLLAGVAAASIAPTWQAILPQLVESREDLAPAVSLDSAGINISRAIGPALAGLIIGYWGLAAPFWLNALSNIGVIGALFWWQPPPPSKSTLLPESFGSAIRAGLRYARYNRPLRATLAHALGFFIFASAYWALLPLMARNQLGGGSELYGLMLGAIGAGAVIGAVVMPFAKALLGPDKLVTLGSLATALALLLFGWATQPLVAFVACALAGLSWIAVVATLNVSAQVALPAWVRGRGLSLFTTAMFGSMMTGSFAWGEIASILGLSAAHYVAAVGAIAAIPLLHRLKLQTGAALDLTPSMHWPAPVVSKEVDEERGPVLVTVEYRVSAQDREDFLAAIRPVAAERRRDGAYQWGIFQDTADEERWLETFLVDSWAEHLRQHERVTRADLAFELALRQFQSGPPVVDHFIGP